MKIPKICKKCANKPEFIEKGGGTFYLQCLARVCYPGEMNYPKNHCYYFRAKAGVKE